MRIEKRWSVFTDGWIYVVAEGLNVTFANEDAGFDCSRGTCQPVTGPPIVLPSVGIEVRL